MITLSVVSHGMYRRIRLEYVPLKNKAGEFSLENRAVGVLNERVPATGMVSCPTCPEGLRVLERITCSPSREVLCLF